MSRCIDRKRAIYNYHITLSLDIAKDHEGNEICLYLYLINLVMMRNHKSLLNIHNKLVDAELHNLTLFYFVL